MKKNFTDITMLLDRSGSMSVIRDDTIGGVNTFIQSQQSVPGEAVFTLCQFDDRYEIVYNNVPIKDVIPLNHKTFEPRGSTALLDSLGRLIIETGERLSNMLERNRPDKVLFVIVTDGHENSSTKFNKDQVFSMISDQTNTYSWEFIYLGANQDAIAVGSSLGISTSGCMNFASTSESVVKTFQSASNYTTNYRTTGERSFDAVTDLQQS